MRLPCHNPPGTLGVALGPKLDFVLQDGGIVVHLVTLRLGRAAEQVIGGAGRYEAL